jgi:hypothetical protein
MLTTALAMAALLVGADAQPIASPAAALADPPGDTVVLASPPDTSRRRHSVEYSDAYYTRLTIHRYGSYAMLPIFVAEYALGQRLLSTTQPPADWIKPAHVGVALTLGALFTSNTVTGVWNLWDSRNDPNGRGIRVLHSVLMLAADAGFAIAPVLVDDDNRFAGNGNNRTLHRNVAIASMSIATLGTAIMWLRKN